MLAENTALPDPAKAQGTPLDPLRCGNLARDLSLTDAYLTSRRERKKVKMLFAHFKRILKLDRLRLHGPNGAKDEFLLATAERKLLQKAAIRNIIRPTQPPPLGAG